MPALPPDEYEVYRQTIFSNAFTAQTQALQPKAYILAGQPGAGKSNLTRAIKNHVPSAEGFVTVDPDVFRASHPKYQEYNLLDDKKTAEWTHEDASRVADEIRNAAIAGKFNLIVDGTLKNKKKALALVEKLKANGYEVHVLAMCVDPSVSWQGCVDRYENQKKEFGYGRWVPQDVHDEAVNSMVVSLKEIALQGLADSITINDRDGKVNNTPYTLEGEEKKESAARDIINTYNTYGRRNLPMEI
jgi:predicted ABC-type ATPase